MGGVKSGDGGDTGGGEGGWGGGAVYGCWFHCFVILALKEFRDLVITTTWGSVYVCVCGVYMHVQTRASK